MAIIATLIEPESETRTAITPDSAGKLKKLGLDVIIEKDGGGLAGFNDADYSKAKAAINDKNHIWQNADIIVKVNPPSNAELELAKQGQIIISFINPQKNETLLKQAADKEIILISMDMIPRISRAQKMDALSSTANIAGYRAILEAANIYGSFLGGQITAAGKVPPAKVLVIGAGVAGLAAIGAARAMGAIVLAFDVRPEVAQQIESMGGEFLFLDFNDNQDSSTSGGYATPSSPEFRQKQLELFNKHAAEIDIVITTALIPGQPAPKLWLKTMVDKMKSGSVVVDLAAEQGGNCEYTKMGEKIITKNGVHIIGYTNLAGRMAKLASTLYANNIAHLVSELVPEKDGKIKHNMADDIFKNATLTHSGKISYPPPPLKVAKPLVAKPLVAKPQEKQNAKPQPEKKQQAKSNFSEIILLAISAMLIMAIGFFAPSNFMQHLIVFVLACFVGFQVIWNVAHALHTPLMSITNAISGIIIVGALLQFENNNWLIFSLASVSIFIATINIVGGFAITRRMLAMFQTSGK